MNPRPAYKFKATPQFWKRFYALPRASKDAVRPAWRTFKLDPFAPGLGLTRFMLFQRGPG